MYFVTFHLCVCDTSVTRTTVFEQAALMAEELKKEQDSCGLLERAKKNMVSTVKGWEQKATNGQQSR